MVGPWFFRVTGGSGGQEIPGPNRKLTRDRAKQSGPRIDTVIGGSPSPRRGISMCDSGPRSARSRICQTRGVVAGPGRSRSSGEDQPTRPRQSWRRPHPALVSARRSALVGDAAPARAPRPAITKQSEPPRDRRSAVTSGNAPPSDPGPIEWRLAASPRDRASRSAQCSRIARARDQREYGVVSLPRACGVAGPDRSLRLRGHRRISVGGPQISRTCGRLTNTSPARYSNPRQKSRGWSAGQ